MNHYRYLCVLATSVPCERLFSSAGYIVNERHSSLDPHICEYARLPSRLVSLTLNFQYT